MEVVAGEKIRSRRFDLITKRRAFWLVLIGLAAASLAARYVLRYIYDSRLDQPARYEQVVWMHSGWGSQQDTLRVWLSHLGKPGPGREQVITQLIGIANGDRAISLTQLRRKYLHFSPTRIPRDSLYVTIAPAQNFASPSASFVALVTDGYAAFQAGTFWKPAVYSFAIRARIENSGKVFRRLYHFRLWAPVETRLLWLGLAIAIYLATTLSVRTITALVGHPQRPVDLLRRWSSNFWIAMRIWYLRKIVCNRIAKNFKLVALGLSLLSAIAGLSGASSTAVAGVLNLFGVLMAMLAHLAAISSSGQLEAVRKKIAEKHNELAGRQEIDATSLYRLAHFIAEIEKLQQLCKELEPAALPKAKKELLESNARLREEVKKLRREARAAYRREVERRIRLKDAISTKIEAARQGIAERILAYLKSAEFRAKIPIFDEMVSEEEFKQKVQDPELVFQGERKERQTFYSLVSLRPQIKSATGEPLLILAVTKEGSSLRIQQFIDEKHPAQKITLQLEKRPSQEVPVKFEVRFGTMMIRPDQPMPAAEKLPVSLVNPEPEYAEWHEDLLPLKEFLRPQL